MSSFNSWLNAIRLRTLPLAMAGIFMGGFLSFFFNVINYQITGLALLTAVLLQILSNLANDYGDYSKGTDNNERVGPVRMTQSGYISAKAMKRAVILTSFLALISGVLLIYFGIANILSLQSGILLITGLMAIAASIKYTVGKNAFGYHGLGDLAVFIFFGLAGVAGSFYLNAHLLFADIFLLSISIGFLSVAVLNLNNMRDVINDEKSGKITLVVRMGEKKSKIYHFLLISLAFILAIIFTLLHFESWFQFLFLLILPLFISDLQFIIKNREPSALDPYLKKQSINTFIFTLLFGAGLIISSYA
jgi:1,4-dihydroxy-2-naphthoate polyprenyltransferase